MEKESSRSRKVRKLRASRDGWKERAAEKQQKIRQLRVTVRDLTASRDHWKSRIEELEQEAHALQKANAASSSAASPTWLFLGG